MLAKVVILYMFYYFDFPTWCKVLIFIGFFLDAISLLHYAYEAGKENWL